MGERIRVLHVDDDSGFVRASEDALEQTTDTIAVTAATDVDAAFELLSERDVDCVVSDYDMPGLNGIEFLEAVRETHPDLPFILFTGKGSEEVASDAFAAGATDYIRKRGGMSQYTVLANRIENAVSQYRAQKQSAAEHRRRKQMLDRFIDGYVAFDEELRFTEVNESATQFLDDSREELLGKQYGEVTVEAGSDAFFEAYEDVLETGDPRTVEAQSGIYPDRWVEARIFPIEDGLSVYFREVTERKERETKLEQERERFSTLFEKFPEPTVEYEYEGDEPVVRAVNEAFEETFGYDAEEAIGSPVDDLVVPPEKMDEARDIDRRVKAGELLDVEVRRQTVDGVRHFNFRNITVEGADTVDGYGVYEDIHERKEREMELERQNDRLEQFTRIVSHDLRNPLNVAKSRLTLARDECDSPHLDAIVDAHDRIETIVDETLMLARQGDTVDETEQISLRRVSRQCWHGVETGDADLTVVDDATVEADSDSLRHVFENLFRNSVEHSSTSPDSEARQDAVEHGSTSSRTESDDAVEHGDDTVTVRVGTLDDRDGFYVADDGPGIPAEVEADLFEFGVSTAENGTGYGLPIVEQVATAHGWKIQVTDSEDGGARFEIET